tara:strand:- start:1030 stop:1869 length:840 start_codon:yes stop_codon:yes gene_type:complete
MHKVKIPKRGKGYRTVYVPSKKEKPRLRKIAKALGYISEKHCDLAVVHGFMKGRSPITNAVVHIGYEHTLSMDLKDFFDTCTRDKYDHPMLANIKLTPKTYRYVIVDGAARQGLPTSPAMSNIAAIPMDAALSELCNESRERAVYTRYADDLTFSSNSEQVIHNLRKQVPQIVESLGFEVNKRKTKHMRAKAGRRHITGVAVGDRNIYPTRKFRRRFRAVSNQIVKGYKSPPTKLMYKVYVGMEGWLECCRPKVSMVATPEVPDFIESHHFNQRYFGGQ